MIEVVVLIVEDGDFVDEVLADIAGKNGERWLDFGKERCLMVVELEIRVLSMLAWDGLKMLETSHCHSLSAFDL